MFDTKVVVYDVDTEETIQIKQNRFYIGRGEDCAIRIKNHMVGMRHALVFSDNGLWYIISFSLCGTWLNDVKLDPTKVYLIHEKEIIDIGNVKRLMIQGTRDDLYQNEVDERSSSDIHRILIIFVCCFRV